MLLRADSLSVLTSTTTGSVYMPDAAVLTDASISVPPAGRAVSEDWNGVASANQELVAARAEIERLNARVRELAAEVVRAQDNERARLARELHDGMGAQLTASRFALARIETWLPINAAEACHEALATANGALDRLCETSHRLVEEGHAPVLDDGLQKTLGRWIGEFSDVTRLHTTFEWIADAPALRQRLANLNNDGANTVFRIVQESLNNAAKHAAAQSVEVSIVADRRFLTVTIKDDGRGIARGARAKVNRFGLAGMRARCEAFGGTLKVTSQAGSGTQIRAKLAWELLGTTR